MSTQRPRLLSAAVLCLLCCHTSLLGAVIPVTDARVQSGLSPYNWVCKDDAISSSVCGASIAVGFKGTRQVTLQVDPAGITTPVPARYPIIAWSVNGGTLQTHQLAPKEESVLLASGVQDPVIDLYIQGMSPFEDRWSGDVPPNSVKITGFSVDEGGSATAVALPAKVWLNIGDSIMSGDGAAYAEGQGRPPNDLWAASDDGRASYGYLLAQHYGYREARIAYGGYNWRGGMAKVPALSTLIDQRSATVSRLSGDVLSPVPAVVLINLGNQPVAQPADRPTIAATRELTWRPTDTSVALLNQGRMVWEHVHDKQIGKPYLRFGLLDGTELTRPWPVPKDYPRSDHSWHRALWWSWKAINGVNYWEGNQTGTEPVQATIATRPDGSAQIELAIAYHRPNESPVVLEKRRVAVSAPDAVGTYFIDWEANFTPAGQDDVRFNQNSYGGFALRMAAECCGDAGRQIPAWTFGNSEGQGDGNNRAARWVSYQGTASNGQAACVAIFDHPDNPRHPALWQTRSQYPYLNPSLTCKEDYVLPSGQTLRLRYGVLVSVGPSDAGALDQRWKAFAGITTQQ